MVKDKNGNIIRNKNQVAKGDEIFITLAKGEISANVNTDGSK